MNDYHVRPCWSRLLICARRLFFFSCLMVDGLPDRLAAGATLEELFDGGTITVGDSQFRDWELISLNSSAIGTPDLSQISVVPLANDLSNPGLQFAGNGQLTILGTNSLDLVFKFRVQALRAGRAFANHELALSGVDFGANGGLVVISDELTNDSGANLEPALVIADMESIPIPVLDTSDFTPQAAVSVVTNLLINGLSAADTITVDSFTQRFAQTGPAILPGDFDADGDADGKDFLLWQRGNSPNPLSGLDLADWQVNYGETAPVGSALAHVPEPNALSLGVVAILFDAVSRNRRRHKFRRRQKLLFL